MRRFATACLLLVSAVQAGPDRAKEIDAYLSRCQRFGFSGAVLVANGGEVLLRRGYGLADRGSGTAITPDTVFEIASSTKPFTACAILKLAEQEKLSLDDPIAKHLPGVPDDKQAITIRHLLSHTSGMPRMAAGGGSDIEAAVKGYLSKPAARAPGAAFEYWNGGYALLAAIVERVSGTSYMDFCRENLFRPAGLSNTGFTGDSALAKEAIGYDGDQPIRPAAGHPYGHYGWQYKGMGGIVTSVNDLWRFLVAYDGGKILSEESRRLMETPVTKNYGLGWGMADTKRDTRRVGHGGDVRGFHAEIERFPEERALVLVLSNVEGIPLWTIAWNLEAILFGETPPYPVPPEIVDLSDEALDRLAGSYAIDDKNRFVVERSGTGLLLRGEGSRAAAALGSGDVAAEIGKAEEVVAAVRKGDARPIEDVLAERVPRTWPGHLVGMIWPRHVERWGELKEVRTLGAVAPRPGYVRVLFELRHENGAPLLEVAFEGGKLGIFRLDAPRFLTGALYRPSGKGAFAAFSWLGRQPPPVRFEKDELLLGEDVRARKAR